jgi:hypothetical protein
VRSDTSRPLAAAGRPAAAVPARPPAVVSLPGVSSRLALLAGVLLSLAVVGLQVRFQVHAGALWRDEVNSVNVAGLPSVREVLAHSHLDSFPAAWDLVLHAWIAAGLGTSDAGLRRLGLAIALLGIAVVWWTARRLGIGAPLLTLLLLGMSPTMVIYGGEVRGYGLGVLAVCWFLGAAWAFVERPGGWRFAGAQAAAVLAAQAYFGNCFLVLAICLAAATCAALRRAPRVAAGILAIGAGAAASMLVNLPSVRYAMRLSPIEQGDWGLAWLARVFAGALAPGVPVLGVLWVVALGLGAAGGALAWSGAPAGTPGRERARFVGLAALLGVLGYAGYLAFIRVRTEYWYYLPLMALLALAADAGVAWLAARSPRGDTVRVAAIALAAVVVARPAAATVAIRMTNLDVIARTLEQAAAPADLVVVIPWYCGIGFQRYYRGPAPWITLPDFDEHRFHLHGLVAEKMRRGDAGVATELVRVEQTLRRGGRVWVVGTPVAPPPGETPPPLVPAPAGPEGWRAAPYLDAWERQLGALLRTHGREVSGIGLADVGAVNFAEHLPLVLVEGWR